MRDTHPWHWNSRKMNHVLPLYLFNQRSCPTAVKCIYRTRCSKFTRFPCIPTREDVWRHCRLVITKWSHGRQITLSTITHRVIDHRDHTMGHEMSQLYKLLWRLREFPFQSSWLSILPLKFFIVSVSCFLPAPLLSNLRMRFLLRGEGCNTPCYRNHNQVT
jgi:hypothetical protein